MALSPDYYSVLGVPSTASRDTIHAAWKALLRQYHPDANHGVDVSARAKEINEAYAVLGKKEARAAYDRSQIRPSAYRATADRPFHPRKAGGRSMRPNASMQPSGSFSQPLETNEWLMGLFLLFLTATPIATILVLYYEESGLASTVRRSVAAHPVPEPPAKAVRSSSGAKLGPGQPAS
jgi:curved DNA-binding protein CbpA